MNRVQKRKTTGEGGDAPVSFSALMSGFVLAEKKFEKVLAGIRDRSGSNEARLLAYFLARQHRMRGLILQKLLNLPWLKPEQGRNPDVQARLALRKVSGVSGRELLDAAMDYQKNLQGVLEEMRTATDSRTAKKHLGALLLAAGKDFAALKDLAKQEYF